MKTIPLHERSVCIIANEETEKKLNDVDWQKLSLDVMGDPINLVIKLWKGRKDIKNSYNKKPKFPILNIDIARKEFKFPPSHPQNGVVYATSEIDQATYIPFSKFHNYMYESKMAAFTKLCNSLGAKSCKIIYAEENGVDITAKIKLENIPTNKGNVDNDIDFSYNSSNKQNVDVFMSFPQNINIYKFENPWLYGEPTWQALQEIRLENDIEKFIAEFIYTDDMGVNLNIANSLNKIGLNLGGNYEEFKKIKYRFEVEFWPKNKL